MPVPADAYTVTEAAAHLGISASTLRSAIQTGRITATRLDGRTNVISAREVERYRRESLGKPGPKGKRRRPAQED